MDLWRVIPEDGESGKGSLKEPGNRVGQLSMVCRAAKSGSGALLLGSVRRS